MRVIASVEKVFLPTVGVRGRTVLPRNDAVFDTCGVVGHLARMQTVLFCAVESEKGSAL